MHLIRTSTYQIMSGLFECIFDIKSKCITDNPGFICTLQSNFLKIHWVYIVLWKDNIKIWFAPAKEGTFLIKVFFYEKITANEHAILSNSNIVSVLSA